MDILGLCGLNFVYSRNINLSREISKLLILPAPDLNDNNFFEIFLPISFEKRYRYIRFGKMKKNQEDSVVLET